MPPVFRFAPSPNGYLHLGHALSALLNADKSRSIAGRLLLRIEDIDTARCRPEYEAAIYEDLSWIGLQWEAPVWRQSSRWDDYRAALSQLEAMGLIYPSFENRAEIARLVAARETARQRTSPARIERFMNLLLVNVLSLRSRPAPRRRPAWPAPARGPARCRWR